MKYFLKLTVLFCFVFIGNIQAQEKDKAIESALSSLPDIYKQLDYLDSIVSKKWASNPKYLTHYSSIYDSLSKLEGSQLYKAKALNYKGMSLYVIKEYDVAINNYLEALRIIEDKNDSDLNAQIYNNLAVCYQIRGDFKNTEKYLLKALELAIQINNLERLSYFNNNLGFLYMSNKQYKKADVHMEAALQYFKETDDKIRMSIGYMNLGNLRIYTENYSDAIDKYTLAINLISEDQMPLVFSVSKTGIGISLTKQKKYSEALVFLNEGVLIAKKIGHFEQLMESYKALADYYSETNDYKNAYKLAIESQKLKDSVISLKQDQNMAEALTKFESEKKDNQLKVLTLEAEKAEQQQRLYLFFAIAGVLIAGLLGFFFIKNKKKNKLLAKQKKLLELTIDEKNVLLKETHHRVKNSFQIVSSLLYLQSETIKDEQAQLAMKEAQNRVRSMVLIHQKLYNKDQLVGIDTQEYFTDLTRDIFESHQFKKNKINYSLDVIPLVLDIETITPLGLILNELITNVIKHAFSNITEDSIMHIEFKKDGDTLLLYVKDNGDGMASEIKDGSFGIKLIKALAKKLKATLIYKTNNLKGTIAELKIHRFSEL